VKRWKLVCGLLTITCAVAHADNWPNWRGPDLNGVSKETNLPVQWSETKNIAWKLKMPGMGGSTPVIWGDLIFLTSEDGNDVVLLCASTQGKELWRKSVGTGKKYYMGGEGNQASASPSTDGKHVWVFVGTGDFACFDFQGNKVWSFNAQERYGRFQIQHGIHTTPLLLGDRLYLCLLHANAHWLIALDKNTGKEIWKVDRPTDAQGEAKEAYTTPCVWHEGGETCLVILGNDYVTCHRVTDGSEVWRASGIQPANGKYFMAHRIISSPAAEGDLLIVPTARNMHLFAMKPGAKGATLTPGNPFELWRNPDGAPDVSTPLVKDGLVYLCGAGGKKGSGNAQLLCLEGKTGKLLWKTPLQQSRYRASPVYGDGKVYVTNRDDGVVTVVKAGRKLEILANNVLPDEFTASPAIANGRIYLRGFHDLYAIQEPQK
jgi:outer membrane protein assembly factor BamB